MDVDEYWFEVFSQGYNSFIILIFLDRYIMEWIFCIIYNFLGKVLGKRNCYVFDK